MFLIWICMILGIASVSSEDAMTSQTLRPAERACQSYDFLPGARIINGNLAELDEFPWMAALVYFAADFSVNFRCGGTIISQYYILSAAHCVLKDPPAHVRVGKLSLHSGLSEGAVNYHISKIIKHPQHLQLRKKNDIALIRVTQSIQFSDSILPACLYTNTSDVDPSIKLIVSGLGSTSADRIRPSIDLMKAELTTSPLEICNATYAAFNKKAHLPAFEFGVTEGQYCAHDPVNRSDSCQGDSGGPLQYFPTKDSFAQVVGVVSFGISCGSELPGIYTRVAHYVDWIESIVWPN